ncbi:MAG TPA: Rieske 2Fe-2S domain-containing protein [Polyangiaceae bacterium]|jgi:phenylpropionate dioxygenase-like ring-hydroxylating dioxygenase large terminal subunit
MLIDKLLPPETKPHVSVAALRRYWYVACRSQELGSKPLSRTVLGVPLVIFRTRSGQASALLDRCPHRNVPLALGRVVGERLECRYHGWQFDCAGACQLVPGLVASEARERRVAAAATREVDGLIWVYPELDVTPTSEPFRLPKTDDGYARVVREVAADATLHATIENALDVPHTGFLHRGLFRGGRKNEISAVVRRGADRVEAEYSGEPRPSGVVGRLLSPGGGVVEHWDRFILPSVAEVEYRLGADVHFLVTALCTPVSDFHTRLTAVAQFKTRFPARVVQRVLEPFALRIFGQDAALLRKQTDNIRRFGGEQYMSTELDLLGPHIWRLLKQAEQGGQGDVGEHASETVVERAVRFFA